MKADLKVGPPTGITHRHNNEISALTQTTDTRIGKLNFENGFPSEETTRRLFDEMDYQRAVQAYLWAYPAVSFESIRIGTKRDLGADLNDMIIADNFADPKGVWLTANDTTIYLLTNVDLGKSGPVVVEIPPGAIVGIIADFWQRFLCWARSRSSWLPSLRGRFWQARSTGQRSRPRWS